MTKLAEVLAKSAVEALSDMTGNPVPSRMLVYNLTML